MKKESKKFSDGELIVDVLEYAFTEWLVRRGVFSAFKTNYAVAVSLYGGFRLALRAHIRCSLCSPDLDPSYLISTAFSFVSAPEGADFWRDCSVAWERFYIKFHSKL